MLRFWLPHAPYWRYPGTDAGGDLRLIASRRAVPLGVVLLLLLSTPALAQDFRVLVFSKTADFRHDSIADGIAMIQSLGASNDFDVDATEVAGNFSAANLSQYAVVVWLNTTGDVLNSTQEAAFRAYVEGGGAWVGIHSATDTEHTWPWYGELIGGNAWFHSHPAEQTATLEIEDDTHESTSHWPPSVARFEEWYNFQNNPRPSVNVLATVDESTYSGGNMGADHPIAWHHEIGSGRAWYTALGHAADTYDDADFRAHVLGGILWAASEIPGPPATCASTPLGSCIAAAQARLDVSEKQAGREYVRVALRKLVPTTTPSSFGNPVSGGTNDAVCVYDEQSALQGSLVVSRAGDLCDSKPCWRALASKGFSYGDRLASADGVTKIQMKSGAAGKGQTQVKAGNNLAQGESGLPLGLAAALAGAPQATLQLVTSNAECFTATLSDVATADGLQFKATTP